MAKKQYLLYTEMNNEECETWKVFIPLTENKAELQVLRKVLDFFQDHLSNIYILDERIYSLDEKDFEFLLDVTDDLGGQTHPAFQVLKNPLSLPQNFLRMKPQDIEYNLQKLKFIMECRHGNTMPE